MKHVPMPHENGRSWLIRGGVMLEIGVDLNVSPHGWMLVTHGPAGPKKRRGSTGKAYRAERRRWARLRRHARREGWAT